MRRRQEGPSGSQPEPQDMQRMTGGTGSSSEVPGSTGGTGATSTGMQETGSTTYKQQGTGMQPTAGYGQGTAPGQYETSGDVRPPVSRHGSGLSILAGALAFLEGLAFIIRSHYYHALPGYPYAWGLHGWGWTILILGALLIAGGVAHLLNVPYSRQFAATVAILTAVVAFLALFYSVIWSIVVIAACGFAAHSLLSQSGMDNGYPAGTGATGYGASGQRYQGTSQGAPGQEAMSGGKRSRGI